MAVKIDKELCTGCGCCGEVCSAGALELEEKAVVFEQYCTACGACIEMCPMGALSLPEQ